jgi:hypothetical protein
VLLGAASFGFFYVVWSCFRTFVAFEGDQVSTCGFFQSKVTAHAGDFVGYDADELWRCWRLVRRADLRSVTITWFSDSGSGGDDVEIGRWLSEHLARAETHQLGRIAEGRRYGKHHCLAVLSGCRNIGKQGLGEERDLELARAAYAISVHGYRGAQADLLWLLSNLPDHSLAKQYVIQALYATGETASVPTLIQEWSVPGGPEFDEQLAAAVCRWSTREHSEFLRKLTKGESAFVRSQAEAALKRLS